MEKLLTVWLYQNKCCPLPQLGSLQLLPSQAKLLQGENKMLASGPTIEWSSKEISADHFVEFAAKYNHISIDEADTMLLNYCTSLKNLEPWQEKPFSSAGSFFMDENGQLHFKPVALPSAFFPVVPAERVIHPDASHKMLVGDTHTSTTAMSELLQESPEIKSKWWLAAIAMAAAAIIVLVIFYSNHAFSNMGNAIPVQPAPVSKTYLTSD